MSEPPTTDLVTRQPLELAHPVLWQAYIDIAEFSKSQFIPSLIMAIGAFGYAWWTGLVTSVGSGLLFVFFSVLAGLLLYLLIAAIRAPFIVLGWHHRQLANLNHRLIGVETSPLSPLAFLPASTVEEKPEPNIVYQAMNPVVLPAHIDDNGFIVEGFLESDPSAHWTSRQAIENRNRLAVVAYFENQPTNRKVGPINGISARLTYIDDLVGDTDQPKVNRGAWLTSTASAVRFGVNDRHSLILAVFNEEEDSKGIKKLVATTAERHPNGDRGQGIYSGSPKIVVQLVAETEGGTLTSFTFRVTLKNGESTVEMLT